MSNTYLPDVLKPFLTDAPCTRCKGEGKTHSAGFTSLDGTVYPDREYKCHCCEGRRTFPAVDTDAIVDLILTGKPKMPKRRFRRSWPSNLNPWCTNNPTALRAYYVWRMARFHGGADVTMPVTASTVIAGDPHIALLDALADRVAKAVFGTDRAAMYRWGNLLGFVKEPAPDGLPESAYEGGMVVTSGEKPDFEEIELGLDSGDE